MTIANKKEKPITPGYLLFFLILEKIKDLFNFSEKIKLRFKIDKIQKKRYNQTTFRD